MLQFLCTNRRAVLSFGAAAALLLPAAGIALAGRSHTHMAAKAGASDSKQAARTEKTSQTAAVLRDLWVGHIFWVRVVCVGLVNKQDTAVGVGEHQSVENAKLIAATIKPFYGAPAADEF